MSLKRPHYRHKQAPLFRWLALVLALLGMLLPLTGWPAVAQLQNLMVMGNACDEGENELSDDDEGGDAHGSGLEAQLNLRRPQRASLACDADGATFEMLSLRGDSPRIARTFAGDRDAAAFSAAPFPLRC